MLLQSVPPAVLVRFLREHRSEWVDYNFDAYSASALKTSPCSLPGLWPMRFSGSQIIMPLAQTVENEEILEVVRLEEQALTQDGHLSRDIHLLKIIILCFSGFPSAVLLRIGSNIAKHCLH
uniref:Uncharacterized protein n=1 Tax=Arundo donax TaxID=35708 RepID=A0A0A9E4L2_ARUDO